MDKQTFTARVMEAILKAWEKRNTLREERYFKTWLTRILLNECYRLARRRPDCLPLESCAHLETPQGEPVDTALREAVLALPEKLRLPVVLCYVEGYSVQEAGRLLRIPAGTVKSRLSRARSVLRETLCDPDQGGIL